MCLRLTTACLPIRWRRIYRLSKGKSKFEVIIILVRANPEPEVIAVALTRDSAVVATDFDCEYAALLLKPKDGCRGFALKKAQFLSASF